MCKTCEERPPLLTSERRDADGHTRLAIHLPIRPGGGGKSSASMDVLGMDGRLLVRLNVFDFAPGGDVDVILGPTQRGEIITRKNGSQNHRQKIERGQMLAVNIIEGDR